jgi:hypothetical protein
MRSRHFWHTCFSAFDPRWAYAGARERTTRPSHCRRCRGRRITLPEFRVE